VTAHHVLASRRVVKKTKISCSIIVLIKTTGPDGLECPKAFDDVAPRVKLHIVARLEDAMWFVELHGGIFFNTLLELAFNKRSVSVI